ncbi:transcription factor IIA, alpha/beta subunit [Echria macrotheca]|uniref:Transcription initiation factor IIA large subunit n=1 Tax=Echria macrotheca TaxID=438768 RepID=A0AAJ0BBX1_9PEZI|nr:transcription factor IIA, alpha/beta subunit [Echria macrotheca]
MSNATVGAVYDHIINEVINSVRVDFEENGVDDGVLEALKKGWQQKLSQLNVAQFPWDPKPDPPSAQSAPASAAPPSAVQAQQQAATYTQSTLSPQTSAQPLSHPGNPHANGNGIAIKQEPLGPKEPVIKQEPALAYNNANAARGGMAAQRAAQALESQYGPRAAASINAIQSGLVSQIGSAAPQGARPGQPQQPMNAQNVQQQQYRQNMQQRHQQQMQQHQLHNTNGLPTSQMDGPSDGFEGVLMQRGPDGKPVEMGRVDIDNMMHAQMMARAKQMEGGGLMLPLKEATRHRGVASKRDSASGPSQVDGPDDDFKEERDSPDADAINSDLDDDDDKDDDENDEDASAHMMLCMYDKVQRVKNKWKCTLKDGVLTVNNREYVFHKATGEYEW